jgi:hypothetical protein
MLTQKDTFFISVALASLVTVVKSLSDIKIMDGPFFVELNKCPDYKDWESKSVKENLWTVPVDLMTDSSQTAFRLVGGAHFDSKCHIACNYADVDFGFLAMT